ncbi:cell division protein FtsX [Jatrophihabitans sp. GAS493]|nr:cell division protein FtsX [Jatrophihabitans sp. GAS493]
MRASFVMSGVATGIRRNLLMTIALVLTTTISLFFLGGAILTSMEINKFNDQYKDKLNVSVYLCGTTPSENCTHPVTPAEKAALQVQFAADDRIKSVEFISKEAAYAKNKNLLGVDAAKFLSPSDFPDSFTLKLYDLGKDYTAVAATYKDKPGVNGVQNVNETLKTFLRIFDSARTAAFVFALLILICAIILMAITIQVAAQQRRAETSIMRLVGASRWMTQLPFIIEAIIAVVIGGILTVPALWFAKQRVLYDIFHNSVRNQVLPGLNINDVLIASGISLGIGLVLAIVTAYITLRAYVRL